MKVCFLISLDVGDWGVSLDVGDWEASFDLGEREASLGLGEREAGLGLGEREASLALGSLVAVFWFRIWLADYFKYHLKLSFTLEPKIHFPTTISLFSTCSHQTTPYHSITATPHFNI
jgi:hypothetical protein